MSLDACGRRIAGDGRAVATSLTTGAHAYVAVVGDLRTTGFTLAHVACFTEATGVERLVATLPEHDERVRTELFDLLDKVGAAGGE